MTTWCLRRTPVLGGAAVVLILLSACGGGSDEQELTTEEQYLSSLLGVASPEQSDRIMRTLVEEQERKIEACMQAAGFDYRAAPVDALIVGGSSDLDDREAVEEIGFGISTSDPVQPRVDNPNDATFAALDEASRAQWTAQYEQCNEDAVEAVEGRLGVRNAAATAERVSSRVDADPSVVDATTGWAECVRREGVEAANPEQLVQDLIGRWDAIRDGSVEQIEAFRAEELELALISHDCAEDLRMAKEEATETALRDIDPDAYDHIYDS